MWEVCCVSDVVEKIMLFVYVGDVMDVVFSV